MKKPAALTGEHPALKNMKFHFFLSIFLGHFCPPGSESGYGSGSETLGISTCKQEKSTVETADLL
jgi:hypothetical protein